jgi:hypothetical protein
VLFVQHPSTAREVSWWKFHQLYFNAYRRPELVAYLLDGNPSTLKEMYEHFQGRYEYYQLRAALIASKDIVNP